MPIKHTLLIVMWVTCLYQLLLLSLFYIFICQYNCSVLNAVLLIMLINMCVFFNFSEFVVIVIIVKLVLLRYLYVFFGQFYSFYLLLAVDSTEM
jgi:hypothetical protein